MRNGTITVPPSRRMLPFDEGIARCVRAVDVDVAGRGAGPGVTQQFLDGEQAHPRQVEPKAQKCRSACRVTLPAHAGKLRSQAAPRARRHPSEVPREHEPSAPSRSEANNGTGMTAPCG